jgi:hypothetical protein
MPRDRSSPCPESRLCFVVCELAGAMAWHCEELSSAQLSGYRLTKAQFLGRCISSLVCGWDQTVSLFFVLARTWVRRHRDWSFEAAIWTWCFAVMEC